MNVVQNRIEWLPGLLQTKDNGEGIAGVTYNAAGLVVKYQKTGGPIQTKILTADDWVEGVDGSYNIRFLPEELDTLGLFSYWIEYTNSLTYMGAVTVVEEIDFNPNITVNPPEVIVNPTPVTVTPPEVVVNPTPVTVNVPAGAGYSMNVTQRQLTWLPVRLTKKSDSLGLTGVAFTEVSVAYQKAEGEVVSKTLTDMDWSEGVDGAYSLRFLPEELDSRGLFQYWVTHPDCFTYPGVAQITESESGPGFTERVARITINNQPIEGAEVWISSDEAGRDIIAGIKLTDALGLVRFNLDPGDYWIHWRKARVLKEGKKLWRIS